MKTTSVVRRATTTWSLWRNRTIAGIAIVISSAVLGAPVLAADLKVLKMGLGSGTVTSSPAGIDCGSDCDETFGATVSVTLTATADGSSTFVGWDVDADADPGTTPDCAGTSTTCTVTMNVARSVRPVFALDPAIPTLSRSPAPSGGLLSYTAGEIDAYLSANTAVNSAARFLAALPDEFKQNWILMSRSESLQTGTAEFPRILLPSADAKSVFTLGLAEHSAYPGAHPDAIEYMQWDAGARNFRFHEVVVTNIPEMDFDEDGVGVIPARTRGVYVDEPRCTRCHSTRNVLNPDTGAGTTGVEPDIVKFKNKPNWDSYDSWGGMSPFNRDRIYQGSLEAAALRRIFNPWTWRSNDFARAIVGQLKLQPPGVGATNVITRIRGGANDGHVNFAFDASPPVLTEPPPTGPETITTSYSFDGAAGTGTATSVTRGGPFVRMQHSDTPTSSEGRGVQLFDLLGGLDSTFNAQRIADELIDHTWATGSVPIDVRPIALAIAKFGCLNINATANTVESATATPLTVDLGFFNARHGMGINELVTDTRNRAESLPLRKADIQKLNLDRTNDVYLDGLNPEDGLIQEYGASTAAGTSTAMSRIRQEVFRRPVDLGGPDSTVMGGIYVDRELYSSNTQKVALFRYFLEPLGVSVDKWSMGVRGRSRTYTFADVFGSYLNVLVSELRASLTSSPVAGIMDANDCNQLITAVNSTLGSLPPAGQVPTYTDVQRIFNKGCIECHGNLDYPPYSNYSSSEYEDTLDLSEYETPTVGDRLDHSHSVAVLRVAATPESSLLYRRITGNFSLIQATDPTKTLPYDPAVVDESCPNFTRLMPCGGPPISQADILTVRRWMLGAAPNTRGDPHIKTIDGVNYDFQAAGEFVLLRGTGLEIQARQTAVETTSALGPNPHTGLTSCVSVNSAVAVRVGPHRITYQPNLSGEPDPDGLQLRVDGELMGMSKGAIPLASGGRVIRTTAPGGIQIEAPGGSVVVITPTWWNHYQLWYMNIDARHIRATMGVMGVIPAGNWLPALPDGSFMGPMPGSLQQRYHDLYEKFGNAWRVSDSTTLFDYAPGTSTATFTIASWPNGESPQSCALPPDPPGVTPAAPPAALPLEVAEQHCEDIIADDARANCVQDVAVTGEPGFAGTYLLSERIERNALPSMPVLVAPEDNQVGLARPVTFTWNKSSDVDGDVVTYRHCIWLTGDRPDSNECDVVSTQTIFSGGSLSCALLVLLVGALLLLVLIFLGKRRPGILILVAILTLVAAILAFYFCGSRTVSRTVTELEAAESYYWKIIADDGKGHSVESETRHFEVE